MSSKQQLHFFDHRRCMGEEDDWDVAVQNGLLQVLYLSLFFYTYKGPDYFVLIIRSFIINYLLFYTYKGPEHLRMV